MSGDVQGNVYWVASSSGGRGLTQENQGQQDFDNKKSKTSEKGSI